MHLLLDGSLRRSPVAARSALATLAALAALTFLTACGRHPGTGPFDGGVDAGDGPLRDAGTVSFRDAGPPLAQPPLWAMLGANAQRNGRSSVLGPRRGALRSVRLADEGLVIVEAIGPAGHVYVWLGPDPGQLAALSPDGEVMWRFPEDATDLDLACAGAALTPDGTLLTKVAYEAGPSTPDATRSDLLLGLDLEGRPGWSFSGDVPEGGPIPGSHGAVVYHSTGDFYAVLGPFQDVSEGMDRHLYAFGADGALRWIWAREVGQAVLPVALTTNGGVRVLKSHGSDPPAADEGLYALDPDTGAEEWFHSLDGFDMAHVSVGVGDRSYVTGHSSSGYPMILAIDAFGELFMGNWWAPTLTDLITTPVAFKVDVGWCFGRSSPGSSSNLPGTGYLACWDKGMVDVSFYETRGNPCGALAVDGEDIVFTVTVGNGGPAQIHGVSVDGGALFTVDLPDELGECEGPSMPNLAFAPALGERRLYVGSTTGQLHIVE